jgi:hypothetical protein
MAPTRGPDIIDTITKHEVTSDGVTPLITPIATAMRLASYFNAKCLKGLVVCAVRYEPVCGWQFPANREKNREFCDFGAP